MRIVCVIPAKGKSSRLPNKNFRDFYRGQSLLEIKIAQCQATRLFDAIYVSSDDERAQKISERLGVEFRRRDAILCQDSTNWSDVVTGILDTLPENDDVWVAFCTVTSPLFVRYDDVIKTLLEKQNVGYNAIATVTPIRHYFLNDHYLPLNHQWGRWHSYSQEIPWIYQMNFACHIAKKHEMKLCGFHLGSRPIFFHTAHWEGLDIDTEEEFELAQWYFARKFGG